MKPIPVGPCDPARLHAELEAAGIKTITVRGFDVDVVTRKAKSGEVVLAAGAADVKAAAVIKSHDPDA